MNFWIEAPEVMDAPLTISEITACDDVELLRDWFEETTQKITEIKAFLEAWREADIDDDEWYRKNAGALAYRKIGVRWLEKRILELGHEPPYWPNDPRGYQLRKLTDKLEKLNKKVATLEAERA